MILNIPFSLGSPVTLGAAGLYTQNTTTIRKRLTLKDKYGEEYTLYEDCPEGVLVPRGLCTTANTTKSLMEDGPKITYSSTFEPRDSEQHRVVTESAKLLMGGQSFITQAPTGFGKTACATQVISILGLRTLIVVTKEDLKDQWVAAFKEFLNLTDDEIGFAYGTQVPKPEHKVVIGMIQSLSRKGKYLGEDAKHLQGFGLVIFDEVHRVGADQFNRACYKLPARLRWGLSATPKRNDGKDGVLAAHIGSVRVTTAKANLTPKVYLYRSPWRIPKVPAHGGGLIPLPHEFGKTMHVEKTMINHFERNRMITRFIDKAYQKGRNIIVFSALKNHLQVIAKELEDFYKIPTEEIGFYWGGISNAKREEVKQLPIILATYSYASEATDIPALDTAVLATPRANVVQIVGRILRQHETKRHPVVFDVADGTSNVFEAYTKSRVKWYRSVGAQVMTRK